MKYSKCQAENLDTKKFCRECGAEMSQICPHCEADVLPMDKFCGECGQDIKKLAEPPCMAAPSLTAFSLSVGSGFAGRAVRRQIPPMYRRNSR